MIKLEKVGRDAILNQLSIQIFKRSILKTDLVKWHGRHKSEFVTSNLAKVNLWIDIPLSASPGHSNYWTCTRLSSDQQHKVAKGMKFRAICSFLLFNVSLNATLWEGVNIIWQHVCTVCCVRTHKTVWQKLKITQPLNRTNIMFDALGSKSNCYCFTCAL